MSIYSKENVRYIDAYPDKAQYRPGEQGKLIVELELLSAAEVSIVATISKLHEVEEMLSTEVVCQAGVRLIAELPFGSRENEWEGYGVDVTVRSEGEIIAGASTAFDVADHWRRAPRYGFLSDFRKDEEGSLQDVESLNKFHINVVQFYDWMYRHDDLIPPSDEFVDPMGRELSYKVVREKVAAVQNKGMAAMAYGAVYASLKDYVERYPEQALYTRSGKHLHLIDIFYIMDITPGSSWSEHIVSQFRRTIEAGFDGIHMDQYGFPKKAVRHNNGLKETVHLADCYPALINRTKEEVTAVKPDAGLIFNNVSNYPVHTTAPANQDAVYIEVWPPVVRLRELRGLIDRARELGEGKQVILSAYLPSFKPGEEHDPVSAENGALLTMASIFASGGYHLLLGEDQKVLTTAYYPDYGVMRPSFVAETRRYYDFIVRYGKLLYDHRLTDLSMTYAGGVNTEVTFAGNAVFAPGGDPGTVWTIIKDMPGYMVIQFINLTGIEDDYWEHGKASRPAKQQDIVLRVLMEYPVQGVYFASPDFENTAAPKSVPFRVTEHEQGEAIEFVLPELAIWSLVYIKWEQH